MTYTPEVPTSSSAPSAEEPPPPRWIKPLKWVLVAIAGAAMWITLSLLIAPGWLPKTRLGWLLLLVFGPFLFALEGLPHAVAEFWKAPASTKRVRFIRRLLLLALLAGGVIYLAFLVDRALLAGDF